MMMRSGRRAGRHHFDSFHQHRALSIGRQGGRRAAGQRTCRSSVWGCGGCVGSRWGVVGSSLSPGQAPLSPGELTTMPVDVRTCCYLMALSGAVDSRIPDKLAEAWADGIWQYDTDALCSRLHVKVGNPSMHASLISVWDGADFARLPDPDVLVVFVARELDLNVAALLQQRVRSMLRGATHAADAAPIVLVHTDPQRPAESQPKNVRRTRDEEETGKMDESSSSTAEMLTSVQSHERHQAIKAMLQCDLHTGAGLIRVTQAAVTYGRAYRQVVHRLGREPMSPLQLRSRSATKREIEHVQQQWLLWQRSFTEEVACGQHIVGWTRVGADVRHAASEGKEDAVDALAQDADSAGRTSAPLRRPAEDSKEEDTKGIKTAELVDLGRPQPQDITSLFGDEAETYIGMLCIRLDESVEAWRETWNALVEHTQSTLTQHQVHASLELPPPNLSSGPGMPRPGSTSPARPPRVPSAGSADSVERARVVDALAERHDANEDALSALLLDKKIQRILSVDCEAALALSSRCRKCAQTLTKPSSGRESGAPSLGVGDNGLARPLPREAEKYEAMAQRLDAYTFSILGCLVLLTQPHSAPQLGRSVAHKLLAHIAHRLPENRRDPCLGATLDAEDKFSPEMETGEEDLCSGGDITCCWSPDTLAAVRQAVFRTVMRSVPDLLVSSAALREALIPPHVDPCLLRVGLLTRIAADEFSRIDVADEGEPTSSVVLVARDQDSFVTMQRMCARLFCVRHVRLVTPHAVTLSCISRRPTHHDEHKPLCFRLKCDMPAGTGLSLREAVGREELYNDSRGNHGGRGDAIGHGFEDSLSRPLTAFARHWHKQLTVDILLAAAQLHVHGLVHGSIHPENVQVDVASGQARLLCHDMVHQHHDCDDEPNGTAIVAAQRLEPKYTAPEVLHQLDAPDTLIHPRASAHVTVQSDLYSIGKLIQLLFPPDDEMRVVSAALCAVDPSERPSIGSVLRSAALGNSWSLSALREDAEKRLRLEARELERNAAVAADALDGTSAGDKGKQSPSDMLLQAAEGKDDDVDKDDSEADRRAASKLDDEEDEDEDEHEDREEKIGARRTLGYGGGGGGGGEGRERGGGHTSSTRPRSELASALVRDLCGSGARAAVARQIAIEHPSEIMSVIRELVVSEGDSPTYPLLLSRAGRIRLCFACPVTGQLPAVGCGGVDDLGYVVDDPTHWVRLLQPLLRHVASLVRVSGAMGAKLASNFGMSGAVGSAASAVGALRDNRAKNLSSWQTDHELLALQQESVLRCYGGGSQNASRGGEGPQETLQDDILECWPGQLEALQELLQSVAMPPASATSGVEVPCGGLVHVVRDDISLWVHPDVAPQFYIWGRAMLARQLPV